MRDVAAERADLLDEAGGDELVAVGRHQEHSLDARVEPGVHPGHLELVFEIRDRAQPANDDAGADRLGEMHQERVERRYLDPIGAAVFEVVHLVADDLDPLVGREQRPLGVVAGDPDHQMVDDVQGAPNDVAMAVGNRVEGAGIDRDAPFHSSSPLLSPASGPSASPPFSSAPFSSGPSGRWATETTRSPSPTLKITTPALPRRAMRILSTGQRITIPVSVTSMIWSLWPTGKTATTASRRRVRSMLLMPCPPRPVMR